MEGGLVLGTIPESHRDDGGDAPRALRGGALQSPRRPEWRRTGVAADNPVNNRVQVKVAPTQVGINELANETGHLGVSINFTWMLITGFLVLFMQVGFAFLVTGLTRAKNAGHMMMMNFAAFAVALLAYYAVGFAFQFGGIAPIANLGGTSPLNGIFGHGSAGRHRHCTASSSRPGTATTSA